MSLEVAFLRDIVEHPDDDAPRAAYADWLMEQSDPIRCARGEFIAVQCHLARDHERVGPRPQWKDQRRKLFRDHANEWLGMGLKVLRNYEFSRGFLHQAMVDPL